MSLYGDWKTATIALNGTTSGEVDLGRDYEVIQVIFPTLTSCTIKLQVAQLTGGTFQDICDSTGVAITTSAFTGAVSTVLKLGGYQFLKFVSSASQGAARSILVRGMRV